jgi:hypothetical protein
LRSSSEEGGDISAPIGRRISRAEAMFRPCNANASRGRIAQEGLKVKLQPRFSLRTLIVGMLVAPPIIATTWWAWRNTLLGPWLALLIVVPLHWALMKAAVAAVYPEGSDKPSVWAIALLAIVIVEGFFAALLVPAVQQ